jgi:hypothetical protein
MASLIAVSCLIIRENTDYTDATVTYIELFLYALWRDLVWDAATAVRSCTTLCFYTPFGVTSFGTWRQICR